MTTTYDKDGAYIEVTTDGVVHRRSIKWKDCVVSVPSGANLKIDIAYINESSQLVLVLEDESEIIMTSLEDLSAHDTDIKAILATLALEATLTAIKGAGWSTQTLVALKAAIDAIPTTAMRGTDGAALASAWTAALATALSAYTVAKAAYLDEAISAAKKILSTDWKGSFNWDTSAYTTVEQDISALFSTNLALVTRRKYSVKLDLTAVEADGSFDELYLAVKEKIDGTNYRAIDRKTITKANIAALAEPGIIIEIPATSENIQITMQMATALAGDATIYYAVVKEHLE